MTAQLPVFFGYTDGLVQERRNSSALAMGLRLSCTHPSIWHIGFNELTHWPLGDVVVTIKVQFSNLLYRLVAWQLIVKSLSGTCHKTSLMISQYWFRLCLDAVRQQAITWTNVEPGLCKHMASPDHNELNISWGVSCVDLLILLLDVAFAGVCRGSEVGRHPANHKRTYSTLWTWETSLMNISYFETRLP